VTEERGRAAGTERGGPPGVVLRWERLHPAVQIAIVGPISVALLWVIHVGPLNQPAGRGFGYAVFWGVIVTGLVVGASRAEHARREARRGEPPEGK
jgi:hypothetical protein